jgi:two-component system cell cycle sensor histidine kinase/response regulator CckA
MAADVAERAFEPFFTTKDMASGTGLGLAIVYGIVQEMHGRVAIESAPGAGTTITVSLPASAHSVWTPSALHTMAELRGHGECILVVEDEPAVREIAVHVLTTAGYEVLTAGSPEQALEQALKCRPSLLLTDVVMPGMSGRELATRLRIELRDIRIVFMSGYTDDIVTRHGIRERQLAFLEKPFTRQTLLERVREAFDAAPRTEAA